MRGWLTSVVCIVILRVFFLSPPHILATSVENSFSVNSILLEDSIKSSLPVNAKWSFSALDLRTGKQIIHAGNACGIPLMPGSLTKLLPIAVLLEMDSKEKITMDTILSADGMISDNKLHGNLYIKGSGNVFLSERDMEAAIEEIVSKGIKEIRGDIVADNFLFDINEWNSKYQGPAFAPPGALGLDLHTVSITVFGRPPNIKIEPFNDAIRINFMPHGNPVIHQIDDLSYQVRGNITDSTIIKKRFSLKDPAVYAALTLKTLLKKRGICHQGNIRRGETPADALEICRMRSAGLSKFIKDTNNNSLNVAAENILLLIGAKRFGLPGTVEKGIMAVKEFLNDIVISPDGLFLADGSGISSENRLSSEQMVGFLEKVSLKPWFKTFYESLPRAGMDGTLKDIGYKNEHVRAKTGQLKDVYSIAGYVEGKDNGKIAFAYIVNVPGAELLGKDAVATLLKGLSDERSSI